MTNLSTVGADPVPSAVDMIFWYTLPFSNCRLSPLPVLAFPGKNGKLIAPVVPNPAGPVAPVDPVAPLGPVDPVKP